MKNINKTFQKILLVNFLLMGFIVNAQFTPINVNTTPVTSSCVINEASDTNNPYDDTFNVSVPSEVLTGDNIPLNIKLPPTNCDINISIAYSSPNNKIEYVTSTLYNFSDSGNITTNDNPIPTGNDGKNFNLFYKFPNYTTCNGEVGTFTVTFTTCTSTCTATVSTTARAANYWTVSKAFDTGNMVCGISKWRCTLTDNNPNPSGFGAYKIQGSFTENPPSPISVVGNSILTFDRDYGNRGLVFYLNNCKNNGEVITNTASYNFTLGDGCEMKTGTVSADSPPLQNPNPSLSFTKRVESSNGYGSGISPGCEGKYLIHVYNNGNVPLQINSITDTIPTNDITITGVSVGVGFVNNNLITSTNFSFTTLPGSPLILAPNEGTFINFEFMVNVGATIGSTINNTAFINYNAIGVNNSNGNSSTSCANANCPTIDESILNDNDSVNFIVLAPQANEVFYKCITNKPVGNIYNLGDLVHFRFILGNGGAGDLSTNITDYLGLPNQNLQIVPSSINYSYYEDKDFTSRCNSNFTNPQPITFGITSNVTNQNDISFAISNMPGTCDFYRGNFLIIEFDAEVLLQMYGNKTNTAYTDINDDDVSYTIDQFGILGVNKRADQEFVENGASFNYIIEVTNSGSVPLDHISISDNLPSCVSFTKGMVITDFANNILNYSVSGSLNIAIDPNVQLMPGQKFTITIPAIKNGGGTCCNESVTANGTMITSGVVLGANFGTNEEPAACVKSTECCDIQDFEAHLYENGDGSYSVEINGGTVPIQQVDISVIDYHVEYNQSECQPQDMGVFGQLDTNTPFLNGLVFETSTNNTSNLTWLPGNPAVMNTSVNFNISKPNVLDLECCDIDFDFCIKVIVKDVNCNVCEKVICPEPIDDPCNISVQDVNSDYCTDDSITIDWTGSDTSGNVAIYLVPNGTAGSPLQIASNQPGSGSLNWTIPSSIKPCDGRWKILIKDQSIDACEDVSNVFVIKCCEKQCECGAWKTHTVSITEKNKKENSSKDKTIFLIESDNYDIKCGESTKLSVGTSYHFSAPAYRCNPSDCEVTYEWQIQDLDTNQTISSGLGRRFDISFEDKTVYKVTFTPICGGVKCQPCEIFVTLH